MLRAVLTLFDRWGLTAAEARRLLGEPSERTYQRWRRGEVAAIPHDTRFPARRPARHPQGAALHVLRRPSAAIAWVRRPNAAFGGRSALDRMLQGRADRHRRRPAPTWMPSAAAGDAGVARGPVGRVAPDHPHDLPARRPLRGHRRSRGLGDCWSRPRRRPIPASETWSATSPSCRRSGGWADRARRWSWAPSPTLRPSGPAASPMAATASGTAATASRSRWPRPRTVSSASCGPPPSRPARRISGNSCAACTAASPTGRTRPCSPPRIGAPASASAERCARRAATGCCTAASGTPKAARLALFWPDCVELPVRQARQFRYGWDGAPDAQVPRARDADAGFRTRPRHDPRRSGGRKARPGRTAPSAFVAGRARGAQRGPRRDDMRGAGTYLGRHRREMPHAGRHREAAAEGPRACSARPTASTASGSRPTAARPSPCATPRPAR